MEEVLEEANRLAERGVTELIVIAQDTTQYGKDLYGESRLPQLLKALCEIQPCIGCGCCTVIRNGLQTNCSM